MTMGINVDEEVNNDTVYAIHGSELEKIRKIMHWLYRDTAHKLDEKRDCANMLNTILTQQIFEMSPEEDR